MSNSLWETRQRIAELGALLFQRNLHDIAGGNMSVRVGDRICLTPRYAGAKHQWHLRPEQVLVFDMDGNQLEGEGGISREVKVHFKLLREFPDATSIVHAHAPDVLIYAVTGEALPPVLEATQKFGVIPVTTFAPAHSQGLADNVAAAIRGNEDRIRKQAAAAIAAWHGLFVAAKDLEAAVDAVERINVNARLVMQMRAMGMDLLAIEARTKALQQALAEFKE